MTANVDEFFKTLKKGDLYKLIEPNFLTFLVHINNEKTFVVKIKIKKNLSSFQENFFIETCKFIENLNLIEYFISLEKL